MKVQATGADVAGMSTGDGFPGLPPLVGALALPDADHPPDGGTARSTFDATEIRDLRLEVDRLKAEREALLDTQRRIMDLLGTRAPEKILHDLRNLLNERELFRALADLGPQE